MSPQPRERHITTHHGFKPTTAPEDTRPYRRASESGGATLHTQSKGTVQTWRQIGWHGQTGAFYSLDERPVDHEPGSFEPLWILTDSEDLPDPGEDPPAQPNTPAGELRTAAARLRRHALAAEDTSPSPWYEDDDVVRAAERMIVADRSDSDHSDARGDLPYIAVMDPGVGLKTSEWLDATADEVMAAEGTEYQLDPSGSAFSGWNAALALARMINSNGPSA